MNSDLHAPFTAAATFQNKIEFSLNKPVFFSAPPAGRRITAGFTWLQRIGKSASLDVWFPDCLHEAVEKVLAQGKKPGPDVFTAEWAAIRQFELLQEAGNLNIIDLDPTNLLRTVRDINRFMHGGGYRVTIATIGSYAQADAQDELAILDQNLQDRIAQLINMLYLEEQSEKINAALAESLQAERWNYQTALPHVGVTLGARDLFRPPPATPSIATIKDEIGLIPSIPHRVIVDQAVNWTGDLGVKDAATEKPLARVGANPHKGQYAVTKGVYQFVAADSWKEVLMSYTYEAHSGGAGAAKFSDAVRKHRLAKHFFEILSLLPQKHINHDTAIGLQLPEANSENQWIYIAPDGEKIGDFVRLMDNLFAPFNKISLSELHGRADAKPEIKPMVGHMRSYGDRLNASADAFYRNLARFAAP